jgi:acyl carrier protein
MNGIRGGVIEVLTAIAPEAGEEVLDDDTPLREQIDLDSMDWLNFLRQLHGRFGVDIPESDYKLLRTLSDVVGYVEAHVAV